MSGIAEILINRNFIVSGSDLNTSENTAYLENLGAKIFKGHSAQNINEAEAEVVVYSSAVNIEQNPETQAAIAQNIPIIRRAEMLAEVARLNYCLAVAGTHGKTTTTSMLALILLAAGVDPTVIVGGRLKDLGGTNARLGKGEWTLVEADEYDRSFLQLSPAIAIINNIETEHLDIYKNFDDIKNTFTQFALKVPFYGFVAAGNDSAGVQDILPDINKKIFTFGLTESSDYSAKNIRFHKFSSTFDVYEHGAKLGEMTINVPGLHNIKNALAATLAARKMGIDFAKIADAISEFHGVFRRFEIKGETGGAIVVDDYAHHPTEVEATLLGAKNYGVNRIIAIFQPHTYTRTKEFYRDFARVLSIADVIIITGIYPAREEPIPGITGKLIADEISSQKKSYYIEDKNEVPAKILKIIEPNDIILTIGAGDIWKTGEKLLESM